MAGDPIVTFYSGGTDNRGRTLAQILTWSDDMLEEVHDYIQWVFPTVAPSSVNALAPLVTPATVSAFGATPELRERLRSAFDRMLAFYGLQRSTNADGAVLVAIDPANFPERARSWLRPFNHNHLRLTRIMQSLDALGLAAEAAALQRCLLTDIANGPGHGRIAPDTIEYWTAAIVERGSRP